jgi:SAM-dependent methyltransferase
MQAIQRMGIRSGDRVLEVGVGTGINAPLYPRDCAVTGIDLSDSMLEKAHERVAKNGLRHVRVLQMDASALTFPDDSFDIVYAPYLVSVVPDPVQVAREMPAQVAAGTVLVVHRQVPAKFPAGHVFVIDPAGECDLWELGDPLENPIVTRQDRDSLLMTHVRLDNVLMPQARKLTFRSHAHVLAGAVTNDPVYASLERAEGKVLVLTVNIDQGDLPLRTAFPILMTNALGWFSGAAGELREAMATGGVTEVTLPGVNLPGVSPPGALAAQAAATGQSAALQLWPPAGGAPRALPSGLAQAVVGPFDRCGVWTIAPAVAGQKPAQPANAPALEIACNLGNRGETDLRPSDAVLALVQPEAVTAGLLTRPIWYYLAALAWLLAGLEWYLYQRRWIS